MLRLLADVPAPVDGEQIHRTQFRREAVNHHDPFEGDRVRLRNSIAQSGIFGKDPQPLLADQRPLGGGQHLGSLRIARAEQQHGRSLRSLLQNPLHVILADYAVALVLEQREQIVLPAGATIDRIGLSATRQREQQQPGQSSEYRPSPHSGRIKFEFSPHNFGWVVKQCISVDGFAWIGVPVIRTGAGSAHEAGGKRPPHPPRDRPHTGPNHRSSASRSPDRSS